jgi:hypothetical protein
MERLIRSIKLLWRSQRILAEQEFRLDAKRIQFNALAALVGVFGLVMLSVAVFYALVPYWGEALAALTVGGTDLALAAVLFLVARSLEPPASLEMVREMREMAMSDIGEEVSLAEAELVALKDDVQQLLRNPLDTLLSGAVGPVMGALVRGLGSAKK